MPIFLNCPNGHWLQVREELAGKKVRCSQCQAIVIVPAQAATAFTEEDPPPAAGVAEGYQIQEFAPPPQPPPDVETHIQEKTGDTSAEPPRKKKKKRGRQEDAGPTEVGLDMVRTGLRLHCLKMVLVLCVLASPIVFFVLGWLFASLGLGILVWVLQIAFWGLLIAPAVLGIVGSAFCLPVPVKSQARPWIIASLVLEITWPLLLLILSFVPMIGLGTVGSLFRGSGRLQGSVLLLVGIPLNILVIEACVLAPWICFMIFLNKVGDYLERSDLAHEALSWPVVIIRWGVIVGVALGVFFFLLSFVRIRVDLETARVLATLLQGITLILYCVGVYFAVKVMLALLDFLNRFRSAIPERPGH